MLANGMNERLKNFCSLSESSHDGSQSVLATFVSKPYSSYNRGKEALGGQKWLRSKKARSVIFSNCLRQEDQDIGVRIFITIQEPPWRRPALPTALVKNTTDIRVEYPACRLDRSGE